MRILLLLCVFLLFNCEDKQTSKQNTTVETDSTLTKNKTTKPKKAERKYPRLTDENALQFFLDYGKENTENKVRMTTDFGVIDILLYEKTKFHRANFIYLTKQEYFTYTQFYRVVPNFVIQGGSSDGLDLAKRRRKIGRYLLPTDTKQGYTHKRGALSMPSGEIENPYKLASPYQFFIVQKPGGVPYLDGDYTIFGEVIAGMDVVDKINAVETDKGEWPLQNVYIQSVEILE